MDLHIVRRAVRRDLSRYREPPQHPVVGEDRLRKTAVILTVLASLSSLGLIAASAASAQTPSAQAPSAQTVAPLCRPAAVEEVPWEAVAPPARPQCRLPAPKGRTAESSAASRPTARQRAALDPATGELVTPPVARRRSEERFPAAALGSSVSDLSAAGLSPRRLPDGTLVLGLRGRLKHPLHGEVVDTPRGTRTVQPEHRRADGKGAPDER